MASYPKTEPTRIRPKYVEDSGPGGGGTGDHSELTSLGWLGSGHTGGIDTLAAFDSSGQPTYVPMSYYPTSVEVPDLAPVQSVAGRAGDVVLSVADIAGAEATANKGVAGGYPELDGAGRVPVPQGGVPAPTTDGYMLSLVGGAPEWVEVEVEVFDPVSDPFLLVLR